METTEIQPGIVKVSGCLQYTYQTQVSFECKMPDVSNWVTSTYCNQNIGFRGLPPFE